MSPFQKKMAKMTARSGALLLLALSAGGCGAARHTHMLAEDGPLASFEEEVPRVSEARAEPAPALVEPQAYASRYKVPAQCEAAARRLLPVSRDDAWTALKSCVEGTHFTLLGALLGKAWAEELRVRPDAAPLIAHVVAQRGGSVEGELPLLHARKVPIFGLSAAVAQPDVYKGRYLLLRAQVADVRSEDERPTVWLVEQELGSVGRAPEEVLPSPREPAPVRSSSFYGEPVRSGTREGSGRPGSGEAPRSLRRYDNVAGETGREALGRLSRADPFFAPGKDFVVLARFDGMRTTSGGDDEEEAPRLPVLTIVSYHLPHPLVVY